MNIQSAVTEKNNRLFKFLLIVTVMFIAFNLRPSITSVGPLIGIIRDDVGFSNWSVAFLTSLPLIAFAVISPIAPRIARQLTNERALAFGLLLLTIGIALRSISLVFFIFLGTFILGAGIAICNVLLPSFIKEKYPEKMGVITSVYMTSMSLFATIATAVSVPLFETFKLTWELTLLIWIIPAIIGLVLCIIIIRKYNANNNSRHLSHKQAEDLSNRNGQMWRSSRAWKIALFMGFQSVIFYTMISWLPEILLDSGLNRASAGFILSYFQLIGIPVSFIVPIIALRMNSQRLLVLIVNLFYIIGFIMLLFNPPFIIILIIVTFAGITQSTNFALSFLFFSIRTKDANDAAELSAMAQTIGYVFAAIAPITIGFLYDLTNAWTIPLLMLVSFAVVIIIMGMSAGQNRYVLD